MGVEVLVEVKSFSVREIDGERYVCIDASEAARALREALALEQRFGGSDPFAQWVRSQLATPTVFTDATLCAPYPPPSIYGVLEAWREFVKAMNVRYIAPGIFDCISGDTPLIVDMGDGLPDIVTPYDLIGTTNVRHGDMRVISGVKILSYDVSRRDVVWTELNWVLAKETDKNQYMAYGASLSKFTSDHRILDVEQMKFVNVNSVRDSNLVNYAEFWKVFKNDVDIPPDLAWVYGYFAGDGAVTSREVYFYTTDPRIADRIVNILNDYLREYEWFVQESKCFAKGCRTNLGVRNKELLRIKCRVRSPLGNLKWLASKWRKMFYTVSGLKKVPKEVLNAIPEAKKAFIDGLIEADGRKEVVSSNGRVIDNASKPLAFGVMVLARSIGLWSKAYMYVKNGKEYVRVYIGNSPRRGRSSVFFREISRDRLVFDLNTGNHLFIAGGLPVHNCDDFARMFQEFVAATFKMNVQGRVWGILRICGEGSCSEGGHAYNWMLYPALLADTRLYALVLVIEPQLDAVMLPQQGVAKLVGTNIELTYLSYAALE